MISEKSAIALEWNWCRSRLILTLSIQEVADWHNMIRAIQVDSGILEHLIAMRLRTNTHILLAKMLYMSVDVGTSKLLGKRDLLQRQLVDGRRRRAEQRCCGKECALHD